MQLLTKNGVANKCKMPVEWVEEAISSGKIPLPINLDGNRRWLEKGIDNWIQGGCLPIAKTEGTENAVGTYQGNLNLKVVEKEIITKALDRANGNREETASLLGIGERTLYRKIKEYGLD